MNCKICLQGQLLKKVGDFYDYISDERFELWECNHCHSLETKGEISGNYYGQAYYGSQDGKFSALLEPVFTFSHKRNANKFYKKFKPEAVLEIGCGRGYMLSELKKLGCDVQGIESAQAAEWILNNPEVRVHGVRDGDQWPIQSNSIDLVLIWHVLEHVTDPAETLAQIKRVLSPQGTLCISVPNIKSLQAKISLRNWFHLDVPRHVFHFSPEGLEMLIAKAGLKLVKKEPGDLMQNFYGWIQTLSNIVTPNHNNILYRFLQGSNAWQSCKHKKLIMIHLLILPLILPISLLGWLLETLSGKHGSMTVYVKK